MSLKRGIIVRTLHTYVAPRMWTLSCLMIKKRLHLRRSFPECILCVWNTQQSSLAWCLENSWWHYNSVDYIYIRFYIYPASLTLLFGFEDVYCFFNCNSILHITLTWPLGYPLRLLFKYCTFSLKIYSFVLQLIVLVFLFDFHPTVYFRKVDIRAEKTYIKPGKWCNVLRRS